MNDKYGQVLAQEHLPKFHEINYFIRPFHSYLFVWSMHGTVE